MPRILAAAVLACLASASAQAQAQRGPAAKSGTQLRSECYRELGYNYQQSQKPSQAVILQVDQCVARKQAAQARRS
jgi:hypothetical protein